MADVRFAIGVFVFSVTAALVIGDQPKVPVIVPAAEVVAVLAALALIRSLQVKAFASIQLAPTLAAIAGQGRRIHDACHKSGAAWTVDGGGRQSA